MNASVNNTIELKIGRLKPGDVFLPSDFKDIGTSTAIRKALSRLVETGRVERMQNGKRVGRKPRTPRNVPEIETESFEQLAARVGSGMSSSDLDALRADKLVEETELLRMRKEKLRGELLPIDLVTPVFVLFSKAMQTAFSDELEDIVREVSHAAKMSKQQTADLRKRVVDVINSATDKGVGEAKKGVRRLTLEYSDTRGRGERIG